MSKPIYGEPAATATAGVPVMATVVPQVATGVPIATAQPGVATARYTGAAQPGMATAAPAMPVPREWSEQRSGDRPYRYREPRIILVDYTSPHGTPPGGRWVEVQYFGAKSAVCCCFWTILCWPIALFIPLMPCDSQYLYRAPNGSMWRDDGSFAGF